MRKRGLFLTLQKSTQSPLTGIVVSTILYLGLIQFSNLAELIPSRFTLTLCFLAVSLLLLFRFFLAKQGEMRSFRILLYVIVSIVTTLLIAWNFYFVSVYQSSFRYKISQKPDGFFASSSYNTISLWENTTGHLRILLTALLENRTLYYSEQDTLPKNTFYLPLLESQRLSTTWVIPQNKITLNSSFLCNEEIFSFITNSTEKVAFFPPSTEGEATSWLYLTDLGVNEKILAVIFENNVIFIDATQYTNIVYDITGEVPAFAYLFG